LETIYQSHIKVYVILDARITY